jgi:glutamyl-tRNA synthetase
MSERRVRVRFAPSPTGPLHIGGVRTALFNYLFAKKHGGDFILRIEDTDQVRFVTGAEEYIIESLEWCGISPDESVVKGGDYGPYRQSDRNDTYRIYAQMLIDKGNAYYAFDTPQELDAVRETKTRNTSFQYDSSTRNSMKNSLTLDEKTVREKIEAGEPYVVRFKMPENQEIKMYDIIREEITVNSSTLDDKVLFKSDGLPTYHLANVVDDYLMKISHVIRGEEWLPSMPLHVSMYRAFGWENEMPAFAHLPLLLKPSGQGKLSKRDGDQLGFPVFPLQWKDPQSGEISKGYKESGYFREAFINILAFLGWNPGTEQEFFSLEELVEVFSLEKVNKSGAKFDPEKAKWFNHHYLQIQCNNDLAFLFQPILKEKGFEHTIEYIEKVVGLIKERATFVKDFWDQSFYFFQAPKEFDAKTVKKFWKADTSQILDELKILLKNMEPFTEENTEKVVKEWIQEKGFNFGQVMNPFRLSLVGASQGPHLFQITDMLGKDETLKRIEFAIDKIGKL